MDRQRNLDPSMRTACCAVVHSTTMPISCGRPTASIANFRSNTAGSVSAWQVVRCRRQNACGHSQGTDPPSRLFSPRPRRFVPPALATGLPRAAQGRLETSQREHPPRHRQRRARGVQLGCEAEDHPWFATARLYEAAQYTSRCCICRPNRWTISLRGLRITNFGFWW